MNKLVADIAASQLRDDLPDFRPGDSVKVHVKVVEGTRSRIQVFAGAVIARNGRGIGEAFTVRKVSFGTGVERTFPLHSPIIDKIEVERRGDVRRDLGARKALDGGGQCVARFAQLVRSHAVASAFTGAAKRSSTAVSAPPDISSAARMKKGTAISG